MLLNNSYTHEKSSHHNNRSKQIKSLLLLSLSCIALSYTPKSNTMAIAGLALSGIGIVGGGWGYYKLTKRIKTQDEKNRLLETVIQETIRQLEEKTAQQSKLVQEAINDTMAKLSEQNPGLIESIKTSLGTALSYVATPATEGWALAKKIPLKKYLTYVYQDVVKKHPYISATAIVFPTLLLIKQMYGKQIYIALTSQLHLTAPQEAPAAPQEEDLHDDAA